ncbi:MAG: S-layer homology domain-containing protein, partial [Acidimicrobiia bacterium]|nr:S-layer homology domain-containing protein [Acidimicrobiia bacterium]
EIAVDGSRSASYINDIPCGASAVFDTVDAVLWFACGPVALMYETGAVVAYTGDFEEVAAQPAGGVLALVGGATPTAGLFDLTSGRTMQVGLPTGSTVMRAAVDPTRGVAVLLRTPCADPCEQVPPEEPDVVADPADLVDFWVTWVGWDGTVEDNFGIVSVGTGPPDKSYSRGNITTDGRVMVVAHPTRITHEFAPDAVGTPWVLVESDGMLRTPFSGTAVTDDLHLAWGGLVQLSYLDGQAEVTFWHLTDQGRFFDDAGQFESDIEAAADAGVTLGCGAEGTLFCPDEPITRAQMASFIARWQGLTLDTPDVFSDDDGSAHEAAINAVADAGITLGCSPSDPARFCPDDAVTRAQMATFIARAMGLPDDFSDHFTDDNSSPHERAIDAIATQGITLGCEPAGTLFCPDNPVLRKHAAAFLARAGL